MKYLFIFLFILQNLSAQELNVKVTVNATTNSTSINPRIFKTLEKTIQDFISLKKWSDQEYSNAQKINCNLIVNITDIPKIDLFKADFTFQSERPVYNTSYTTQVFRHIEKSIPFSYVENDPIVFSDNVYNGSLGANLAFYAYMMIALDKETFKEKSGNEMFEKALNLCDIIPQSANEGGESVLGFKRSEAQTISGQRSKVAMALSFTNTRMDSYRKAIADYHINGLDLMEENPKLAKENIVKALEAIKEAQKINQNYIINMFVLSKQNELFGMFKNESPEIKKRVIAAMQTIEPSISDVINQNLK
jgi:hypothetical protein